MEVNWNTYLYIQSELQPIQVAAQEGQVAVVQMLVEEFHIKPDVASNVIEVLMMTQ